MNNEKINPKIQCKRCSHIQDEKRESCSACGLSFVFGVPDRWKSFPISYEFIKRNGILIKPELPLVTVKA